MDYETEYTVRTVATERRRSTADGARSTFALSSRAPRVKAASCAPETAGALRRRLRCHCGAHPRAAARAQTARSYHCRAARTLAPRVCARRGAAGGRPARCRIGCSFRRKIWHGMRMACAWHGPCPCPHVHVHVMSCACMACARCNAQLWGGGRPARRAAAAARATRARRGTCASWWPCPPRQAR